jgi:hypothetical protein
MPDPRKRPHGAAEHRAREEAERQERKEAKRRERREEVSMALRGLLIIWDIVWALLH